MTGARDGGGRRRADLPVRLPLPPEGWNLAMFGRLHSPLPKAERKAVRDEIVLRNLRLVPFVLRRQIAVLRFVPAEDLYGYGYEGLITAVDRFVPALGYTFSTFARSYVRTTVYRRVSETEHLIAVPDYIQVRVRRDGPGDDQYSLAAANALSGAGRLACWDAPAADPAEAAAERDEVRRAVAALDSLGPRDAEVMRLWFGLDGRERENGRQIAARVGRSYQRVAQIKDRSLEKLRAQLAG